MKPEDLAEGVRAILSHSPSFPGRKLVVDIIANPNAGGFKRRRFAGKRKRELNRVVQEALALPLRAEESQVHLHRTERCGHAAAIAQRVLERSSANGRDSLHIIMTAGGDGTSLETAERLCDRVAIIKNGRLVVAGEMEEVRGDASLEDVFLELENTDKPADTDSADAEITDDTNPEAGK